MTILLESIESKVLQLERKNAELRRIIFEQTQIIADTTDTAIIIYAKIACPPPFEAPLLWAIFLLIDFPILILVMITTSGQTVVSISIPFYCGVSEKNWQFNDVIWSGLVFQFIGTINWLLLKMFYLYLFEKKKTKSANPIQIRNELLLR
ncbi:MAG: hypothetical protein LBI18_04875 [Planctomycetaceae bacterium]|jgi:hypothetical protein|nr:hypothetical protein [Planctomycetaceae bacterium]